MTLAGFFGSLIANMRLNMNQHLSEMQYAPVWKSYIESFIGHFSLYIYMSISTKNTPPETRFIHKKKPFWGTVLRLVGKCLSWAQLYDKKKKRKKKKCITLFFLKNCFKWELTWENFLFSISCDFSLQNTNFFIQVGVFLCKISCRIRIRGYLPW